ncbi:MAG: hypothetical protein V8R91_21135 [Butyricimonas faecihominis]
MVRVSDGHIVDEKSVFVAVSTSDVDAGIERVCRHDAGHGGEVFQYILFANGRIRSIPLMEERIRPLAGRAVTTTSSGCSVCYAK